MIILISSKFLNVFIEKKIIKCKMENGKELLYYM